MLTSAVLDPPTITGLSHADLDLLLRVARKAQLLGRLAEDLKAIDRFGELPDVARDQFDSMLAYARSRRRVTRWEMDRIAWALRDDMPEKLIVMKGCAYELIGSPNNRGRIFADVDLMVAESEIEPLEAALHAKGWQTKQLSAYDDNYYRRWTHELPPITHYERHVEVDVHHNILPRTARLKPSSGALYAAAVPVDDQPFHILSDTDLLLHAAVHLMFSDEMADKIRDLIDIADLANAFAVRDSAFWPTLMDRAEELGLERPAFYALHFSRRLLELELPQAVVDRMEKWAPPGVVLWMMQRLVPAALFPTHPEAGSRRAGLARWLLFVRSHWIRMPPWLLVWHLSYKFYLTRIRRSGAKSD